MEMNEKIKRELTDDEISKVSGGTGEDYGLGNGISSVNEFTRWYDEVNNVTFEYKCPDCGRTMDLAPNISVCMGRPLLECDCGIGLTDPSEAIKIIIGSGKIY